MIAIHYVLIILALWGGTHGKAIDTSVKFFDKAACEQAAAQVEKAAGTMGRAVCVEVR